MIISVIGFGHIGSVIGSVIANQNNFVYGIDKNKELLNSFLDKKKPISEPGLQELVSSKIDKKYLYLTDKIEKVSESDVVIITVGTPLGENNKADLSHLSATCEELEPYIKEGHLILVKSTVPPGTTRNVVHKLLSKNKKNIDVVFSPERLAEGNAIKELKTLPIIIGGLTDDSAERASEFWKNTINVETIIVNSAETSEFVKLANNAWIDLNIGLAHDLARLSDNLDLNIDIVEVINAANTLKKGSSNVNILTPSNGVGGYCLTKDPWFLYTLGLESGLELSTIKSGRIANDIMPKYCANKITEFFNKKNSDFSNYKISILGLSFKTDSGDIRFTPVLPFIKHLEKSGFKKLFIFDPLVTENDLNKINLKLNNDIYETIRNSDCVIFMTAHKEIANLSINDLQNNCNKNALIFDGRRYFTKVEIREIVSRGLSYTGVGR